MGDNFRFKVSKAKTDKLILAYVETHPGCTYKQIGDGARVSAGIARNHLYTLRVAGRVTTKRRINPYTGRSIDVYFIASVPTQEEICQRSS